MKKFTIYCDGASRGNPGEAGIGFIVLDEQGSTVRRVSDYLGKSTNNVAEYTALIRALQETIKLGGTHVRAYSDSELVVKQLKGEYRVKNQGLLPLFQQVAGLAARFEEFIIEHLPREQNKEADDLANKGIDDVLT